MGRWFHGSQSPPSNAHATLQCARLSSGDEGRWLSKCDTSCRKVVKFRSTRLHPEKKPEGCGCQILVKKNSLIMTFFNNEYFITFPSNIIKQQPLQLTTGYQVSCYQDIVSAPLVRPVVIATRIHRCGLWPQPTSTACCHPHRDCSSGTRWRWWVQPKHRWYTSEKKEGKMMFFFVSHLSKTRTWTFATLGKIFKWKLYEPVGLL